MLRLAARQLAVGAGLPLGADWLVNSLGNFLRADKPDTRGAQAQADLAGKLNGALFDSTIRIVVDGQATATVSNDNSMGGVAVYSGLSYAANMGG